MWDRIFDGIMVNNERNSPYLDIIIDICDEFDGNFVWSRDKQYLAYVINITIRKKIISSLDLQRCLDLSIFIH